MALALGLSPHLGGNAGVHPSTLYELLSDVHRSMSWKQQCLTQDRGLLTLQSSPKPAVQQKRLPSLPSHLHYVTPTEILSQILP